MAGAGDRAAGEGAAAGGAAGRLIEAVSAGLAVAGGLVLVAILLASIASILGRALFSAPIPGDFELVEIGCAVAVFSFLPWCQLRRGNVIVDVFTSGAPLPVKAALDLAGALLLAAIAALLARQLWLGLIDVKAYNDRSMVLGLPLWWGFCVAVPATAWLAVVAAYTAWRDFALLRGRS
ncbi:MAG: hypothetical protein OHK0024_16820 [Thalassobaculales bacterium]